MEVLSKGRSGFIGMGFQTEDVIQVGAEHVWRKHWVAQRVAQTLGAEHVWRKQAPVPYLLWGLRGGF